jgi:hypothetical protein
MITIVSKSSVAVTGTSPGDEALAIFIDQAIRKTPC